MKVKNCMMKWNIMTSPLALTYAGTCRWQAVSCGLGKCTEERAVGGAGPVGSSLAMCSFPVRGSVCSQQISVSPESTTFSSRPMEQSVWGTKRESVKAWATSAWKFGKLMCTCSAPLLAPDVAVPYMYHRAGPCGFLPGWAGPAHTLAGGWSVRAVRLFWIGWDPPQHGALACPAIYSN